MQILQTMWLQAKVVAFSRAADVGRSVGRNALAHVVQGGGAAGDGHQVRVDQKSVARERRTVFGDLHDKLLGLRPEKTN